MPWLSGCVACAGQLRASDRRLRQDRRCHCAALPASARGGHQPGAAGHRRRDHLPGAAAVTAEPGTTSLLAAESSDAIALFADRARAQGTGVVVDEQTAPLVVSICTRLDGLP